MKKKTKEQDLCPECPKRVGGKDAACACGSGKSAGKTAAERIEALREAGVDVSNLFAMHGANGGDFVACNRGGQLSIVGDDDPLFASIMKGGTVPNRKLFRRWVMAQMFHMLSDRRGADGEPAGFTRTLHAKGYEYQWTMLVNELRAQSRMYGKDMANFVDRNRWFNRSTAEALAKHYIGSLEKHVSMLPQKKCKGIPYKTVGGRNVFLSDMFKTVFRKYHAGLSRIMAADNPSQLLDAVVSFNGKRIRLGWGTPQCREWVDAYKGSGSYFTLQNMIRFHGCTVLDDGNVRLDKAMSLAFIGEKARLYCGGNGWRMFALLKKCLDDNGIDVFKKMAEWRKRK